MQLRLTGLFVLAITSTSLLLTSCGQAKTSAPPVVFITEDPITSDNTSITVLTKIKLAETEPDEMNVWLEGVGIAADGGYIAVYFKAPPEVAGNWWQGSVYVVDEISGVQYAEIPVMPVVGPLFAKPQEEGQQGYCMLTNTNRTIKPGSVVTVVLGLFKREHVTVQ